MTSNGNGKVKMAERVTRLEEQHKFYVEKCEENKKDFDELKADVKKILLQTENWRGRVAILALVGGGIVSVIVAVLARILTQQ